MTCSERELGDDLLTLAFLEDGGVITNIVINLIVSLLIYLIWMCFNRNKSHSMEMLPLLQDESDSGSQVVRGTSTRYVRLPSSAAQMEEEAQQTWITKTLRVTDEDLKERAGREGKIYLQFLKSLCQFLLVCSIIGCAVLLPVNLTSESRSCELSAFSKTTVYNISISSGAVKLWAHLCVMCLFSVMAIILMGNFQAELRNNPSKNSEKMTNTYQTIWIQGLRHDVTEQRIRFAIDRYFHQDTILSVDVPPNFKSLHSLIEKKKSYKEELNRYLNYYGRNGEKKNVGISCCSVDGIEYYTEKIASVDIQIKEQIDHSTSRERASTDLNAARRFQNSFSSSGNAFVTFRTRSDSLRFLKRWNEEQLEELKDELASSAMFADKLRIREAPDPKDIFWSKLGVSSVRRYLSVAILNILLVLGISFLIMPSILLYTLRSFESLDFVHDAIFALFEKLKNLPDFFLQHFIPSLIFAYVPAVVVFIISMVIPYMVIATTWMEGHKLKSSSQVWIFKKTVIYLITFLLLLPFALLVGLDGYYMETTNPKEGIKIFGELFFPNLGAFFLNFVLFFGFIGNISELLRVPSFVSKRLTSIRPGWQRDIISFTDPQEDTFPFAVHYAWNISMFLLVLFFSCFVPLILPAGLFHFSMKYLIDKYNLCFGSYVKEQKSIGRITRTVGSMLNGCLVFFQLGMCTFFALRIALVPENAQYIAQCCVIVVFMFASALVYFILGWQKRKFQKRSKRRIETMYFQKQSYKLNTGDFSPDTFNSITQTQTQTQTQTTETNTRDSSLLQRENYESTNSDTKHLLDENHRHYDSSKEKERERDNKSENGKQEEEEEIQSNHSNSNSTTPTKVHFQTKPLNHKMILADYTHPYIKLLEQYYETSKNIVKQ